MFDSPAVKYFGRIPTMTRHQKNLLCTLIGAAFVGIAAAGSAAAAPVTYDFNIDVGGTSVSGFFTIDGTNPGYIGGGKTTKAALLNYEFDFTRGAASFTGTPANVLGGVATFDITYAADLLSVAQWDISIGFNPGPIQFAGNNINGGFAQVGDTSRLLSGFTSDPQLTATLRSVPAPGSLALVALGLASMLLGRRRNSAAAA